MEIKDSIFYLLELESEKHIFPEKEEAMDTLKGIKDPSTDKIAVYEVDVSGDKWNITQIPWGKIAEKLLSGDL